MKKFSDLQEDAKSSYRDAVIVFFDDVAEIRNLSEAQGLLFFDPKKYYYGYVSAYRQNEAVVMFDDIYSGRVESFRVSPENIYIPVFFVGDRVAIKWNEDEADGPSVDKSKIYYGNIIRNSDPQSGIISVNFDEDVNGWGDPNLNVEDGHGWSTSKKFLVYPEAEPSKPQSSMRSRTIVRNTITDLITNVIFDKDSNRVMLLLDEMKNKFGQDFEAELVLSDIFTRQEAELFIEILNGLKREEDVRLGLAEKIEAKPAKETKAKRGRKKKLVEEPTEIVIEPEIEIEEPDNDIDLGEIENVLSEEDLGDLLDELEGIEF
jgi:hypothetical protein